MAGRLGKNNLQTIADLTFTYKMLFIVNWFSDYIFSFCQKGNPTIDNFLTL
jgi:hypothetical protein